MPTSAPTPAFTLQILHQSDERARLGDLGAMVRSAAIIDRAEDDYANTITIVDTDLWLPGRLRPAENDPAVVAAQRAISGNPAQAGGPGRTPIAYLNAVGADVATFGAYRFDPGDAAIAGAVGASSGNAGARFPILAAISGPSIDSALQTLIAADAQDAAAIPGRIAGSTVVTVGGERIGVLGMTVRGMTPLPSPTEPAFYDTAALAAATQPRIDALLAQGVTKVILLSDAPHQSQDAVLVRALSGVDVVISRAEPPIYLKGGQLYPQPQNYGVRHLGKDNAPVLQLRSQERYSSVGRYVVEFDAAGTVLPYRRPAVITGLIEATDANVAALWGGVDPYAPGSKGVAVQALPQAVIGVSNRLDGNVLGFTSTFLNGEPQEVGSQETSLGRVVAAANLRAAQMVDPATAVAFTSASAFRGSIGTILDGRPAYRQPPAANPGVGKPYRSISQLDIEAALEENRGLSLITVTAVRLLEFLEHGVAAYTVEGSRQFPQLKGLRFSFDPSRQAQVLDGAGTVTTPGERIRNVALANADDTVREVLVQNGRVLGDPDRPIRIVVPDALANGGDGYRFDLFGTDRVMLSGNPALQDGAATFAAKGTEHDAFAEYLQAVAPTQDKALTAFYADEAVDLRIEQDSRIQNLSRRGDDVLRTFFPEFDFNFYNNAKTDFLQSTFSFDPLRPSPIVLSAPGLAGLGAPVAGERTFARVIDPAAGSNLVLPAGFQGLIAGGDNAVTLSASTPSAILIGNAGRSALTTTGAASTLVAGTANTSMLAQGGSNTVFGGSGDDSMAGGGTFFTGRGNNLVSLNETGSVVRSEGRDTVFTGLAGPASDTIGATGFSSGTLVFAGAGRLTFINADAPSTVMGGAGGSATIFGGTGGGIFQGGSAGGNQLIGGRAAYRPQGTRFVTGFSEPDPVGNGTVTLIGGGDGDLLYANGFGQNILMAGPGNSTLIGGAQAGGSVFVGAFGTAATTVTGGNDADIIFGGTGSLVADGGVGIDLFVFTADRPGGTTIINGFNPGQDRLALLGHDPAEPSRALFSAQVANGSTTLTLADNTRITFTGVTDLGSSVFI